MIRDRDGRSPLGGALLLSVCSSNALLGDLIGVSRSMERDLLSVLSIYPGIFLHVSSLF